MTGENRTQNIADELSRAEQGFRAAEALIDLGLSADAVSRAYYALFHVLRALLFHQGAEPKSHQGAVHLFNTEIVRKGLMDSSHNRTISGLQRSKELADYDAAVVFSVDDAKRELAAARNFEAAVLRFLAAAR
jgi:uncharacterized protein (UPF0332 family)